MIIYSLWFYEVDGHRVADFVRAFREGGILYESLYRIPGHIHTDLLSGTENPSGCYRLLSISFFTSLEELLHAQRSAEIRTFAHWLRERTKHCIFLGSFSHFPRPDAEIPSVMTLDQQRADITPMEMPR